MAGNVIRLKNVFISLFLIVLNTGHFVFAQTSDSLQSIVNRLPALIESQPEKAL